MAATISSSRDNSSPLESIGTFSPQFTRTLVEDYAKNELASDLTSKILFAFLDHLPPDGLCNVCEDIIQARNDLRELADHYILDILIPSIFSPVFQFLYLPRNPLPLLTTWTVRAGGGKTPSASTSRFDDLSAIDTISSEITTQKRNQARLKTRCLARDNNRCMLSGWYDVVMAEKLSAAEQQSILTGHTEAAHIIPFSLAAFSESEVFTLPSYTNFLASPLNSVNSEPLLGVLYSEPSLASGALPLMTSIILVVY